jgi:hypothetical protein
MNKTELQEALARSRTELLALYDEEEPLLAKRYKDGKWTIREILCHLADKEMVLLWRLSRAIAEPGSRVEDFDQDKWARALVYEKRPLDVCGKLFEAARVQILHHVELLTPELMEHTVEHSELGTLTVETLLTDLVKHTRHHVKQIRAAREG